LTDKHDHYEIYNLLYWISVHAPDCELAQKSFEQIQQENPVFKPRDNPDLDHFMSPLVRLAGESPIETDEILSKDIGELIDYVLEFRGDHFRGPHREGLLDRVGKAAKERPTWGLNLAEELIKRQEWKEDLWRTLLYAWPKMGFDAEGWNRLFDILSCKEVQKRHHNVVANILWDAAEMKGGLTKTILGRADDTAEALWNLVGDREPREASSDWLGNAINDTSGQLVLFWLHSISRYLEIGRYEADFLPDQYKERFSTIVAGSDLSCQLGRVVLASQILFLFALDRKWTVENALPLLDWNANKARAEQCWHGFIAWGDLRWEMLEYLKPYCLQAAEMFPAKPERTREHLMQHLANMAVSLPNPLDDNWLDHLIPFISSENDMRNWTWKFSYMLSQVSEDNRKGIWDRWLKAYCTRRADGIPIALGDVEAAGMIEWILELRPVFEQAVEVAASFPKVEFASRHFYRHLKEDGFSSNYAHPTATLFLHLLQGESHPLAPQNMHLCGEMIDLLKSLRNNGVEKNMLDELCNELAELGCNQAMGLWESLDESE